VEISVESSGNDLEIAIGEVNREGGLQEIFDPDLSDRPWSLGLFLNIAHKIIADHGGKMLFQAKGQSAFPLLLRLPMRGQFL
jgi:nitrogen-specific signal transduction histidine kinase